LPAYSNEARERAARLFRALGDGPRSRLLELRAQREWCVTEIVPPVNVKVSPVSRRLRVLRTEGQVKRRRTGTHLSYALADRHVTGLFHNALEHAQELEAAPEAPGESDKGG
jgi:ArsR family transcriptional regulator